jgi:ankyrin repeat protein
MSLAALKADMSTIELLFHWGADIHSGQLLHFAAQRTDRCSLQVILFLLDHGAWINAVQYQNDPVGWAENKLLGMGTPLHVAAHFGNAEVVKLLLMHGADSSIRDSRSKTAIDIARDRGHSTVVQILQQL